MLLIRNAINKARYKRLIEYAFTKCDMFTLRVPTHILEEENEFRESIFKRLKIIEPYLVKKYIDDEYFGDRGGDYEIHVVSFNQELVEFLVSTEGLYNWEYPKGMPEDLCFIADGCCWLKSIAHEEICRIYTQSDTEKVILKRDIGLKFVEWLDVDIPIIQL